MKKIHYPLLLLLGALLVFSIFPLLNYYIDPFRVLHIDYKRTYNKINTNQNFLKVAYLLDNKEKYDTILMGSSRNGGLNENLVSRKAYNLLYSFNIIEHNLHNLKVLLEHKVKFKNLWIGINDYDIWKNPLDHEKDYTRKKYPNDLISKVYFYRFYLLRKMAAYDTEILRGKNSLRKTDGIVRNNTQKYYFNLNKKEVKDRLENPKSHIEKMTKMSATLLGYQDYLYRIDKSIEEIETIKKLCDENKIKLTIFTYPTFYKTYLSYNQYKIEEFKRKLSQVIDFHDFYDLNNISLNELNWRDSSHFTVSVGNYIIDNIQKNNFLVTKDNIDLHIEKTRNSIKNILNKNIPIKYIGQFNTNISLKNLHPIFNLKNNMYMKNKNSTMEFENAKNYIKLKAKTNDPSFVINKIKAKSENVILHCSIISEKDTLFQIFIKKTPNAKYNAKDSAKIKVKQGLNEFNILIPSDFINNKIRIDLASSPGIYYIKEFIIYGVK